LHNKFLAPLPGTELNCVFKVYPFILVISIYDNLKKINDFFPLFFLFFCSFCYFNFFLLFYSCGEIFLYPMDHVHISLIFIIMLEIVLKLDNFLTIIMSI
jgi:hypothetical protein